MNEAYNIEFRNKAEVRMYVKRFLLNPNYWIDVSNHLNFAGAVWNKVLFEDTNVNNVPKKKGVYAFILIPKYDDFIETRYLFYVGKTNRTLFKRFQEYLDERDGKTKKPRDKVREMLNIFEGYLWFHYMELTNTFDVNKIEEKLLNCFVPHVNCMIPNAKIKSELKNIYEK